MESEMTPPVPGPSQVSSPGRLKKFLLGLYKVNHEKANRKLWVFHWFPYRMGISTTVLTGLAILMVVLLILILGGIASGLTFLFGGICFVLFYAALIFLGVVGFGVLAGDDWGLLSLLVPAGTIALAIWIYTSTYEAVHDWIDGVFVTARRVFDFMYQPTAATMDFIGENIPGIVVVILLPLILLGLVAGIVLIFTGILNLFERSIQYFYGIKFRCPSCAHSSEPAKYQCPKCHTPHPHRLIPGRYGIFRHRCTECRHPLPSMMVTGRIRKVPRSCQQCDTPLNEIVGSDRHIALVGGRNTGKTTLLIQMVNRLMAYPGAKIPEKGQQTDFKNLSFHLRNGEMVPQTQKNQNYRAFQIVIPNGTYPAHIHLHDIAGEYFKSLKDVSSHQFFQGLDAVVFLVDPYSIPNYVRKKSIGNTGLSSQQTPTETFHVMAQVLERFRKNGLKGVHFHFLLVKADKGYLPNWKKAEEEKIRKFMQEELELAGLVHSAEQKFKRVSFRISSALGSNPESGNSKFHSQFLVPFLRHLLKGLNLSSIEKKLN